MIAQYIRTLMNYHAWATGKLLEVCSVINEGDYHRELGLHYHGIHGSLNQLLIKERYWYAAYHNQDEQVPLITVEIIADRDALAAALRDQCRQWQQIVKSLNDEQTIQCLRVDTDTGLALQKISRVELLFQVISYAISLRGQLISALTSLGLPELRLDFFSFYSEN